METFVSFFFAGVRIQTVKMLALVRHLFVRQSFARLFKNSFFTNILKMRG